MDIASIKAIVGEGNMLFNEPMKNHTTMKVGGNAAYYLTPKSTESLIQLLSYAKDHNIAYFIIGGGSDIIVSDNGIQGFVIKPSDNFIAIEGQAATQQKEESLAPIARHESKQGSIQTFQSLDDLKYTEDESTKVLVTAGAGVSLPYLISYTLQQELCGLHWFGYIPANVGGAIFNNIHGMHRFLSEYVETVRVWNRNTQNVQDKTREEMHFAYDKSSVQDGDEVVLSVTFGLYKGDIAKARYTYQEMVKRKVNNQPAYPSAGSVFKNLDPSVKEAHHLPSLAVGWLVDNLQLLGTQIGGAQIYEKHGNFIINKGNATAKDVYDLVCFVQQKVEEKWHVRIEPEIRFIGMES